MEPLTYPLLNRAALLAAKYGLKFAQFWVENRIGLPITTSLIYKMLSRKRRFPSRGWTVRKRPRYARRYPLFRGRRFTSKVMGRRAHKTFPRRVFMGSRKWNSYKLAKCIESKMLEIQYTNNTTLTNGLVTTTREYAICPNQNIVQNDTNAGFHGTCIWMRGIRLDFFVTTADTFRDHMFIQVDIFRTKRAVDYSAFTTWTQLTNTGTELETDLAFYDRVYGATSTFTDAQNFLAPVNRRGAGPKHLARHRWSLVTPSAASGTFAKKCHIWFPMNQLVRFRHDNFSETALDTAPNYFDNGDIIFIMKFYNSQAAGGNQNSIVVSGTTARLYYKDA